jgi:hypothetical protein
MAVVLAWRLAAPSVEQYKAETPVLRPEVFFNGTLQSWGMIQNLFGKTTRHFTARQAVEWHGNQGVMHETLNFSDGTVKQRQWHFTLTDDHHVIGTAPDVAGEAVGEFYGNALHWKYDINVDSGSGEHTVTFDDWLFLTDPTHMFSLIRITKFGLPLGTLTMFFEKAG